MSYKPNVVTMCDAAETNVVAALAVLSTSPGKMDELSDLMNAIEDDTTVPTAGPMSVEDMLFVVAGNLHRINKKLRENPSGS
jgi:hypothetical protein